MIGLKDSTLVNEIIKHLGYKTSKYIKVDPYVHFNWICHTIYTFLLFHFKASFHLQRIFWFDKFVGQHDVMSCNVMDN